MQVQFKIKRFNPEKDQKPYWGEYTAEVEPTDRVLDGVNYIKWNLDGSLTYRRSCAHGICGSDVFVVNGRNRLACKFLMKQALAESKVITVEPMRGFPVIKDLVVDMEGFFAKFRSVKPYLINNDPEPTAERYQSPAARERFDDTTKCILCAACTTACPTFWADKEYVGPAAIVQAHRFIFDSRDQGADERLAVLADAGGVFTCRSIFNCVEACPRGIDITKAIYEVRQAMLFNKT
ncbi:MAG: succinate dehydrogenase iron-sulfur subunit [Chloroflexota bacterium]|nr:succinate dehydrogenase iron-sulfur subunit [Chloroflexota bacterium]